MQVDLAILADAFSAKEIELDETLAQLNLSMNRETELSGEVEASRAALLEIQRMIKELQSVNDQLAAKVASQEATVQAMQETSAASEAKLAAQQQQLQGLKTEISSKTKVGGRLLSMSDRNGMMTSAVCLLAHKDTLPACCQHMNTSSHGSEQNNVRLLAVRVVLLYMLILLKPGEQE